MRGPLVSGHALLAAIFLATSVTARSSRNLFERDGTCPDTTHEHCTQAGVPENFCCPTSYSCVALAANTTLLCCPPGNSCGTIQTVTCDITSQNVTLHPNNQLKTTALTVPLPVCGDECCPFGYSCNSKGDCSKDQDQSKAPGIPSSSSAISSSPTSSSTTSISTSSTTTSSPSTNTPSPTDTPLVVSPVCAKFPVTAVLAGFFPGLALGILLSLASVCILGAKRRKAAARRRSGSSFGNISEPQPSSVGDMRTDFLRKQPQTPSTTASSSPERRLTGGLRVKSLFRKGPDPREQSPGLAPLPLNVQRPMALTNRPVTPPSQRDPSFESYDIAIFADGETASSLRERERGNGSDNGSGNGRRLYPPPSSRRDSFVTQIHDFVGRSGESGLAGLQKGQPFKQKESPGYTPPRK